MTESQLNSDCVARAKAWQREHQFHVHRLITFADRAYAPTGSDAFHPELWKPAHWKWFVEIFRATAAGVSVVGTQPAKVTEDSNG